MRIDSADVVVSSPGRNYVTLRIVTDTGIVGLGDATLNGRELAVVSYLRDHVAPLLIGRDAHAIEDTWQYLYRGAYWRRGPVTMAAIAAVDVALWDIKAKAARMPLYQLLGGASRSGSARVRPRRRQRASPQFNSLEQPLDRGFPCTFAFSPACQAWPRVWCQRRCRRPRLRTSRLAGPRCPRRRSWDSATYLRHIPEVFAAVRDKFGRELHLLHDAHHRLTPIQAARPGPVARAVSPVLARGLHAGGEPGGVRTHPPAHRDSTCGRRGLQHDLRLSDADLIDSSSTTCDPP